MSDCVRVYSLLSCSLNLRGRSHTTYPERYTCCTYQTYVQALQCHRLLCVPVTHTGLWKRSESYSTGTHYQHVLPCCTAVTYLCKSCQGLMLVACIPVCCMLITTSLRGKGDAPHIHNQLYVFMYYTVL